MNLNALKSFPQLFGLFLLCTKFLNSPSLPTNLPVPCVLCQDLWFSSVSIHPCFQAPLLFIRIAILPCTIDSAVAEQANQNYKSISKQHLSFLELLKKLTPNARTDLCLQLEQYFQNLDLSI